MSSIGLFVGSLCRRKQSGLLTHGDLKREALLYHGDRRKNTDMPPQVLRPKDLADRWGCSQRHVRDLLRQGTLPSFRIGGKLIRIPIEAVEEIERCSQNLGLSSIEDGSMPNGVKTTSNVAKRFVPAIVGLPSKR